MSLVNKILFFIGITLLAINIYGLFKSLRNPAIYEEEKIIRNRIGDVKIKYPEIKEQLIRKNGESNIAFAVRINKVVNDGFAHYWKAAGIEKYNIRVPVWENYLLYFASYINPSKYREYEFSNYRKNLERGVGLCSTHSIVVKGVLNENGMHAELLDIDGHHVVVRAELGDSTYLLDPDFGVVVPFDTAAISLNPELVRESYSKMAALYYPDAKDPYTTDYMVKIFGGKMHVYDVNNRFEYFSYLAIWIVPVILMIPFFIQMLKKQRS